MIRKLTLFIAWSLFGVALLMVSLVFLVLSDQPLVTGTKQNNPETFVQLKSDLRDFLIQLRSDEGDKILILSHKQLEEAFATVSHVIPRLNINYNHAGTQLLVAGSLRLPASIFGEYLNFTLEFMNQSDLLDGNTNIGPFSFDNAFVYKTMTAVAASIFDEDLVYTVGYLLTNAKYDENRFTLVVDEAIDSRLLIARLKDNAKLFGNLLFNDEDYADVQHYYDHLLELSKQFDQSVEKVSLSNYLTPLMLLAHQRSEGNNAVIENTNAILALGLFAGEYHLKSALKQVTGIVTRPLEAKIYLGGRNDLMKHFLYSAIIQLFSSSELSFSIGELKELSDLDLGGSGFSFADLAADRTGIHFVTAATGTNTTARQVQTFMINSISELDYFPNIAGLEEGLNLQNFDLRYEDINSAEYLSIVDQIDNRILALPLMTSLRRG